MIDDGIRPDRMAGEEGILGWNPITEDLNIFDPAVGPPPPRKLMIIDPNNPSDDEDDISDYGRYDYMVEP